MSNEYGTYRHSTGSFALSLPNGWEASEEVEGCALVAAEPDSGQHGFAPNIVVTVEELSAEESLDAWAERSREALRQSLTELRIIDTEELEIGGLPARRTLSHYMHPSGGINLEQWALTHEGLGYVVSCSMTALDYDDVADAMGYMAESLRVEGVAS